MSIWQDPRVKAEIRRCSEDFLYFTRYLEILTERGLGEYDEDGKELVEYESVPWELNDLQLALHAQFVKSRRTGILKARQMGCSTLIAGFFFWEALLHPPSRVLIVAQGETPAAEILGIYAHFYRSLPKFLQFPLKAPISSQKILFQDFTGRGASRILAYTDSSDKARSGTNTHLHASEVAFWDDFGKTRAAVWATITGSGYKIVETTAELENEFPQWWYANNGVDKLFFPWITDPRYVSDEEPEGGYTDQEMAYIREHKLPPERARWYARILREDFSGDQTEFNREYPINEDVAFIASGDRFFTAVSYRKEKAPLGEMRWAVPEVHDPISGVPIIGRARFRCYVAGVDTATGSEDGDTSVMVVADCTEWRATKKVHPVYRFQDKIQIIDFKHKVLEICKEFDCLVVVEKSGGYGMPIIDHLWEQGYGRQYRSHGFDAQSREWSTQNYGWDTTKKSRMVMLQRLHEYMARGHLAPLDPRLRQEVNTFIWTSTKTRTGDQLGLKPQAAPGNWDDCVVGYALMLMGLEQIGLIEYEAAEEQPVTGRDMLRWERQNRQIHPSRHRTWDDSHYERIL